ncbi:nuclear membrane fusion kar5 [Pyrenophora seminiperda CCB06]|uniref:Nuclear membrane fusion kar5 n=1 Tax=Pyrenophora seminiperda CCB06 TaxID=1302712 RepID=A0A3M7MJB0_9PLEO|nr:nuclear membrane fusion kar5 [Pyrenophora seminiperda CCB06]
MNECKLLEHAPDYAKSQPEAYLDNIKTEYAAKLAVCELLSAQPINPVPPPHCGILVPHSKHCGKAGGWWHTQPEVPNDKQCYSDFKDYQYMQCLKSLQSTPQYWTSFSNARQNAVVMCQASRDAIERENHLETFKNLTQVLGGVTSTMQEMTEEYESLVRKQRQYSEEAGDLHDQLKNDIHAVQEKAVATVGALDEKFSDFMKSSISELITALADSQSNEINRIHDSMQAFSQDLIIESSQLAKYFTGELQQYHDQALASLQTNHMAQVDSYNVLSTYMGIAQQTINKTGNVADRSLSKIDSISQRLDVFETQTEHIAKGFAFLGAIPVLFTLLFHGLIGSIGTLFMFTLLYRINAKLATYSAGACSSAFLLHICGVFDWIGSLPSRVANIHAQSPLTIIAGMSSWQKGAGIVLLLWLGAYPVCRINAFLGTYIAVALERLLGSLWFNEYSNDGGMGYLPRVEIPARDPCHKGNEIYGGIA